MLKKFVFFEINKVNANQVIDVLSKYRSNFFGTRLSNLRVLDGGQTNKDRYLFMLRCKRKDLNKCLNDFIALERNGVNIHRLTVR